MLASVSDRRLIAGGQVVTASSVFRADVLVADGLIVAVGRELDAAGAELIDATGCYVLPGAIDAHTHVSMPAGPVVTVDDYDTATAAAAMGGTTTIIDFVIQRPGQGVAEALSGWRAKLDACPLWVDVGFHFACVDLGVPGALEELAMLPEQGISSFKLFMAYSGTLMVSDRTMLEVMRVAAASGVLVLVHCENGDVVDHLVAGALARGDVSPVWHARTRPPVAETEATGRAIALAAVVGAALYIVHVSCQGALAAVTAARAAGQAVLAETCPQYLRFTESDLDRDGFEGARYVCSPPLRSAADQEALWRALAAGGLDAVNSDHCPFRLADQKTLGRHDFSLIPNGVSGVEERVMLLYDLGVRTGRISLSRWVELVATAPARIFGLAPRKGSVVPGADADLVVFDPARPRKLSASSQRSAADHSLYEGVEVAGSPSWVLLRGEPVVADGMFVGDAPRGEWVARARVGEGSTRVRLTT